jgi:hypothetical protein
VRLTIVIGGMGHQIDSADPDMIGKWIVEIFGRMRDWNQGTYISMQAYPSSLPDENGGWRADWIADSRIVGQSVPVRSPRELADALSSWVDEWERLRQSDGEPASRS